MTGLIVTGVQESCFLKVLTDQGIAAFVWGDEPQFLTVYGIDSVHIEGELTPYKIVVADISRQRHYITFVINPATAVWMDINHSHVNVKALTGQFLIDFEKVVSQNVTMVDVEKKIKMAFDSVVEQHLKQSIIEGLKK